MAPKRFPRHLNIVAEYKIVSDEVTAQFDRENTEPDDRIIITRAATAPSEVSTTSTTPAAATPTSTTFQSAGPSNALSTSEIRSYNAEFCWRHWRAVFSCTFSPNTGADDFEVLFINDRMTIDIASPWGKDEPKALVSLRVCQKEDDNGNLMLEFGPEARYSGCTPEVMCVWAKRVMDGKDEGLSKREKKLFRAEDEDSEEKSEKPCN